LEDDVADVIRPPSGYGDLVPFEPSQYVFTSVYILVGVGLVGSLLGFLISSILDQVIV
jgi:hypothetical protein